MDVLSLLKQATVSGLQVAVEGDDLVLKGPKDCSALVAEIGRRKPEVITELRARTRKDDPAAWNRLSAQRWGSVDESPGIDVPADSWRSEVASWPLGRWLAWRRRVDALLEPKAMLKDIQVAELRAYDELSSTETNPAPTTDQSSTSQQENLPCP